MTVSSFSRLLYTLSHPCFSDLLLRPYFSILHHRFLFSYPSSRPCFPPSITSIFFYSPSRPFFPFLHHVLVSLFIITSLFLCPSTCPCFSILRDVSLSIITSMFLYPSTSKILYSPSRPSFPILNHVLVSLSFITSMFHYP